MDYANTKIYAFDAGSTSYADMLTALRTHWTTAPGLWEVVPGVPDVAGESLVIREKTAPTQHLQMRRNGTSDIRCTVYPDADCTDAGDATTPPTASGANASPECKTGTMSGLSTRMLVIEMDDAICVIFQNATKTATPYGIHAGVIYDAARDGDDADGLTGHGALVGHINTSGTNAWTATSAQVNGSRVRTWNNAGVAEWDQVELDDFPSSSSTALASTSLDELVKSPRPIVVKANNVNGSSKLLLGQTRWLAAAPISALFPNNNPLRLLTGPTAEAWMYLRNTAAVAGLLISWERGVNPS